MQIQVFFYFRKAYLCLPVYIVAIIFSQILPISLISFSWLLSFLSTVILSLLSVIFIFPQVHYNLVISRLIFFFFFNFFPNISSHFISLFVQFVFKFLICFFSYLQLLFKLYLIHVGILYYIFFCIRPGFISSGVLYLLKHFS